jgi:hypothetical protein
MLADYEKYVSSKSFSGIDPAWKRSVNEDICNGDFAGFTSANASAKQFAIFCIDKNGYSPKVIALGCSVHKITIGESYDAK